MIKSLGLLSQMELLLLLVELTPSQNIKPPYSSSRLHSKFTHPLLMGDFELIYLLDPRNSKWTHLSVHTNFIQTSPY